MIDIDVNVSKKIKYYLYIYNDMEKMIRQMEIDIIDSSSGSVNTWLRGKHCFTNTIENQAITLASSRKLKELKEWKNNLGKILNYIYRYYPVFYKYIELKYFRNLKNKDIKKILKLDINMQNKIDKNIISLIALCVDKTNFFYKM